MLTDKLPSEIIQKIFGYVEKNSLYAHLFVCKQWYSLIEPIYFQDISWSTKGKILDLKKQICLAEKEGSLLPFRLFPMTKALRLSYDVDYDSPMIDDSTYSSLSTCFTAKEFIFLLSLFPNLEVIDLSKSTHKLHYMEFLRDVCDIKLLPFLEEIKIGSNNDHQQQEDFKTIYFTVYYKFRHTLKCINLHFNNNHSTDYGKGLLDIFPDFKSLHSLEIYNKTDSNLTLFHLLQVCPNLSVLKFFTTFEIPKEAETILNALIQYINQQKSTPTTYFKNLKVIEATAPSFTRSYVDFFTDYCPETLNSLKIEFTKLGYYSWIEECFSKEIIFRFAARISKVESLKISFNTREENPETRRGIPPESEQKIDIFYQLLNSLMGDRRLTHCEAIYKERADNTVSICFDGKLRSLFYEYHLDEDDYLFHLMHSEYFHTGDQILPWDKFLLLIPSSPSLISLEIINDFKYLINLEDFKELPIQYLELARCYCPHLDEFKVEYYKWNCHFIARQSNDPRSPLENMTYVLFEGAEYSQDMLDNLIKYFPKVKVFHYIINSFQDIGGSGISFNLSNFEHLHTLNIDVEGVTRCMFDNIFFGVQFFGSEQVAYHVLVEIDPVIEQEQDQFRYKFQPTSIAYFNKCLANESLRNYSISMLNVPQHVKKLELSEYGYAVCTEVNLERLSNGPLELLLS